MQTGLTLVAVAAAVAVIWAVIAAQARAQRLELVDQVEKAQAALLAAVNSGQIESLNNLQGANTAQFQQVNELTRQAAAQMAQIQGLLLSTEQQNKRFLRIFERPYDRGSWGEFAAEDILRYADLVEHVHYEKQQQTESGSKPDFTFFLPPDRRLHMDSKFPLDKYELALGAASDEARRQAQQEFFQAVRKRIKEVTTRDYIDPEHGTLSMVLLFIPSEAVYSYIHEHAPEIFREALQKHVAICSPVNLYSTLMVVRQAAETHALQQRSEEVLETLLAIRGQWDKFTGKMDDLGHRINAAHEAFTSLATTRVNMLDRAFSKLEAMEIPELQEAVE